MDNSKIYVKYQPSARQLNARTHGCMLMSRETMFCIPKSSAKSIDGELIRAGTWNVEHGTSQYNRGVSKTKKTEDGTFRNIPENSAT